MKPLLALRQLVGRLGALSIDGALDTAVAAVAYDARRVVPGAVFFAVPRAGGEDWQAIPQAIERGAAAVVYEQAGHVPYRATRIRVADCRRAMAAAAAAFYGHPSHHMQVIVVTGCQARGAVAHLLYQLLSASGIAAGLIGSLGCRIGQRTLPPVPAEPESLDMQELLAGMQRAGCRACVVELAPRAIERGGLAATEIHAAFATDLGPEAGEGNKNTAAPAGARAEDWRWLWTGRDRPSLPGGGWRVSDTMKGRAADGRAFALRLDGYLKMPWTVQGRYRRFTPTGTNLEARTPQGELRVRVPVIGRSNAQASVAAAMLALTLRVPFPAVMAGLGRLTHVPGSLEPVRTGQGFHVFVDGAATRHELESVLRSVREVTAGSVLALIGGGSQQATADRAALGEVAAREADFTMITSDNPGWQSPEVISDQIATGYSKGRGVSPQIRHDRAEAIREVVGRARRGDCVLLTGKGHRMVQELGGCVLPFDDRVHARAALAAFDSRSGAGEVVEL